MGCITGYRTNNPIWGISNGAELWGYAVLGFVQGSWSNRAYIFHEHMNSSPVLTQTHSHEYVGFTALTPKHGNI
jgi:hypothetical protein